MDILIVFLIGLASFGFAIITSLRGKLKRREMELEKEKHEKDVLEETLNLGQKQKEEETKINERTEKEKIEITPETETHPLDNDVAQLASALYDRLHQHGNSGNNET